MRIKPAKTTVPMVLALCGVAAFAAETPTKGVAVAPVKGPTFYVSTEGRDAWSGRLSKSNADGTDGPFASLERARDAVRALKAGGLAGSVTVFIRGGTYFLPETVVFTPEDSGTADCPITYAAHPGETPVFSGGERISGWKSDGGRWTADVPGVKEGRRNFIQLFVNGERRFRPRLPKEGFFRVVGNPGVTAKTEYRTKADCFIYADNDLKAAWSNLSDVEVVVLHFWVDTHLPIATIDPQTRLVTFTRTGRRKFTDDFSSKGARYYVQNVAEALTEPGEWYLDRRTGRLTYLPRPGEKAETAEVVAPRLSRLVSLEGDPKGGRFVEHLRFEGLTFAHSQWILPEKDAGDLQAANTVPGAFWATGARHCELSGCTLTHLGTYAVQLEDGCSDWKISRNEMCDLGAGGVRLSGGTSREPEILRTDRVEITDNHIHHIGQVYHSAVGILSQHSGDNVFAHNHIHHTYYTGISVGWVWGYAPSVSRNNRVEFNHIHDIGQGMLSDMGGIYTLGVSPGTVLRNNVIHDVLSAGYGGWGLYTDEGSSEILLENNIVYRTKTGGYHHHYGRENILRNNIFALSTDAQLQRTRTEEHVGFTFERNIVYWKTGPLLGSNWKDPSHFRLDYNLYWNASGKALTFAGKTLEQWRAAGQDVHSLVADPLFVDPEKGNFAIRPESPASKISFKPIDAAAAGVRGR